MIQSSMHHDSKRFEICLFHQHFCVNLFVCFKYSVISSHKTAYDEFFERCILNNDWPCYSLHNYCIINIKSCKFADILCKKSLLRHSLKLKTLNSLKTAKQFDLMGLTNHEVSYFSESIFLYINVFAFSF